MLAKWVAGVGQQCSYKLKISQLVDSYNGLVRVANKKEFKMNFASNTDTSISCLWFFFNF